MLRSILPFLHTSICESMNLIRVLLTGSTFHNMVRSYRRQKHTLISAQSVGLSASQGALYSALFNITSGIGRIAFGFLADAFLGVSALQLI